MKSDPCSALYHGVDPVRRHLEWRESQWSESQESFHIRTAADFSRQLPRTAAVLDANRWLQWRQD